MTAEQVWWLVALNVLLCLLTAADIGVMVYIYFRAIHTGRRVENLLSMAEAHGKLTDSASGQVLAEVKTVGQRAVNAAVAAARTASDVRAAVEQVPDKTVERFKADDTLSVAGLPAVPGSGRYPKAAEQPKSE